MGMVTRKSERSEHLNKPWVVEASLGKLGGRYLKGGVTHILSFSSGGD